jgi:hypothetical protein
VHTLDTLLNMVLTKDDTIYLVTVNGATITLPNPSDNNLIGKLFIIKVNVEEWSTLDILNVAAGVGNTLIDNSVSSLEIGMYSSTSWDFTSWQYLVYSK